MNKYETAKYEAYKKSKMTSLRDAYGTFSAKKQAAWDDCVALMRACHGTGLRVVSRNPRIFTAGFTFVDYYGNECFAFITPTRSICCCIEG